MDLQMRQSSENKSVTDTRGAYEAVQYEADIGANTQPNSRTEKQSWYKKHIKKLKDHKFGVAVIVLLIILYFWSFWLTVRVPKSTKNNMDDIKDDLKINHPREEKRDERQFEEMIQTCSKTASLVKQNRDEIEELKGRNKILENDGHQLKLQLYAAVEVQQNRSIVIADLENELQKLKDAMDKKHTYAAFTVSVDNKGRLLLMIIRGLSRPGFRVRNDMYTVQVQYDGKYCIKLHTLFKLKDDSSKSKGFVHLFVNEKKKQEKQIDMVGQEFVSFQPYLKQEDCFYLSVEPTNILQKDSQLLVSFAKCV